MRKSFNSLSDSRDVQTKPEYYDIIILMLPFFGSMEILMGLKQVYEVFLMKSL